MRKLFVALTLILLALASSPAYAAPPSPGVNIVANGDFSAYLNSWNNTGLAWDVVQGILRLNNNTGSLQALHQTTGFTAANNDIYEVTLSVGNNSSVSKSWSITLDDAGSNSFACNFSTAAGKPLELYRMRGRMTTTWSSLRFLLRISTLNDSTSGLLVDNINIVYTPSAQVTTTLCDSPTATATPTATFTPSPTATPTPDFFIEFDLGDNQYARVERTVSGGDYVIIVLLAIVLFGSAGIWLLRELRGDKS